MSVCEFPASNAPGKTDSTNGNGMRGISFSTTDNWLKSLKYGVLIGRNQFLPENQIILRWVSHCVVVPVGSRVDLSV